MHGVSLTTKRQKKKKQSHMLQQAASPHLCWLVPQNVNMPCLAGVHLCAYCPRQQQVKVSASLGVGLGRFRGDILGHGGPFGGQWGKKSWARMWLKGVLWRGKQLGQILDSSQWLMLVQVTRRGYSSGTLVPHKGRGRGHKADGNQSPSVRGSLHSQRFARDDVSLLARTPLETKRSPIAKPAKNPLRSLDIACYSESCRRSRLGAKRASSPQEVVVDDLVVLGNAYCIPHIISARLGI